MIGYDYHPAAETEYLEAIRYYAQINSDLAISLVVEVEFAIERARRFPEAHPRVSGQLRRVLTHRFPYAVIYEVLSDRIFIWAVAHTSREPGYWQERT